MSHIRPKYGQISPPQHRSGKKSPQTVLVVEDNPLMLRLFRDLLHARGFETVQDETGRNAQRIAQERQPELIILDVLLPAESGLTIAQSLKQNPQTAHIPILAATAFTADDMAEQMMNAGCYNCLSKPFSLDQFFKALAWGLKTPHNNLKKIVTHKAS
jgi:two-component system cell cycle response regulator DivK